MKPKEFEEYTPNETWLLIEAWEENQRLEWERTRAICYNIHAHSMAEKKSRSPQQFWPFSWDEKTTAADPHAIFEQAARMEARKKLLMEKMKVEKQK